jgi:outer membrane protein OmpA-like peptidoglycan-associated protein
LPALLISQKRRALVATLVIGLFSFSASAEGLNRVGGPTSFNDSPQASSADLLPNLTLQTGLNLDYSHAPLVLRDVAFIKHSDLVEHQFSSSINAAMGFRDVVQLDLALPISVATGQGLNLDGTPSAGLQDMTAGVRLRLTDSKAPLRTALSLKGTMPTSLLSFNGMPTFGEVFPTLTPGVLLTAGNELASVTLNTGYTIRIPKNVADLQMGHTVNAAVGGQLCLLKDSLWLVGDVGTSLSAQGLFTNRLFMPVEATLGFKGKHGPFYGMVAAGSGLLPDVGTPDVRVLASLGLNFDFATKQKARTTSKLVTEHNPLPPPLDSDGDGILDQDDKCPNDPEDFDGFEDSDGCPEQELVVIESEKIILLSPVYFFFDSDQIKPESFQVLNDVATVLKEHTEIKLLSIEGHASAEGELDYNQALSERRALAIVKFLQKAGVATERLVALGHGENNPAESNKTKAGREKNRRVEFRILEKQ